MAVRVCGQVPVAVCVVGVCVRACVCGQVHVAMFAGGAMSTKGQATKGHDDSEADPGRGVQGLTPPPRAKDCPADSEIWRKGVADRL